MRYHHALGCASGTGGVDDIHEVACGDWTHRVGCKRTSGTVACVPCATGIRNTGHLLPRSFIQAEQLDVRKRKVLHQMGLGQYYRGLDISEYLCQSFYWIGGIEGHISTSSFEHT